MDHAMSKRAGARSIGCSIGIGLMALAIGPHCLVHAQSADLVLCDRLAADPADPDKPANVKGTPEIAASDVATALKFSHVASASSRPPLYLLGRRSSA